MFKASCDAFIINKKRKIHMVENVSINTRDSHCSLKKHKLLVRCEDGTIKELRPEHTLWYLLYIANSPQTDRMRSLFRLRFCLPHSDFLDLASDLSNHEIFNIWKCPDATVSYISNKT